jgi:DNA-directed RNA polymerase I subunit RPA1
LPYNILHACSVVQFLYGEDGLDPTKAPFLDCSDRTLEFLIRNHESMKRHSVPLPNSTIQIAAADASVCKALDGNLEALLQPGSRVLARRLREGTEWKRGAICRGWFEATIKKKHKHGKYFDLEYVEDGHQAKRVPLRAELGNCGGTNTAAATSIAELVKPAAFDPVLTSTRDGHRLGSSGACISERVAGHAYNAMKNNLGLQRAMSSVNVSARDLGNLVSAKYSSSLCAPGEAVGSIAAQSIGEPSTQMTLNTFHLAGAGANVTLGIPRLREIIMTASRELKTPTMSVPLKDYVTDKQAIRLTRKFTKLTLMELICGYRGVTVTERLERGEAGNWSRAYYIKIKCHPAERIREAFGLSLHDVARVIAGSFVPKLSQLMKKELKRSAVEGDIGTVEVEGGHSTDYIETKDKGGDDSGPAPPAAATRDDLDDDADDDDDDGDAPGDEDGADSSRYRRRSQSVSYDDDDGRDGEAETATPPSSSTAVEEQEEDSDEATSAMFKGKDALHVNERANTISLQSLRVDPSARPLLMVGLVESAAATTVVRARKNINQAFINEEENGRGRCFQTAGINFEEIWKLDNVDHNRLMSNDIWAVRNAYGVEAAAASIKGQITSVFGAYGIEVDPRHLSLIADYMTLDGGFKAMNRTGMETSSSPFLQMSFETTAQFLRQAAIANDHDKLSSPSGNIVLGRPIRHGTGSFTLLAK